VAPQTVESTRQSANLDQEQLAETDKSTS